MKTICLKNGKEVIIREALQKDAQSMINFYNIVGGETDFLSFGKNEFSMSLNDYENFIESTGADNSSIILLATMDDEIISIASITSSPKARTKHVGTLGIVIAEEHCGFGLGRILMEELIEWAKLNGTTKRIHLVTREDNAKAIELYKKVGFKEEGLLQQDTYINGVYYNTLIMGLLV
ncbi:GNAT family N-acetyltransferase [Bacillus rhizoplanae]|uniref:GNAT family N-acetyltransferase n=1 Tax=Bacillus rhizoplanae TaxID=2880966 RepID=UPI003D2632BF